MKTFFRLLGLSKPYHHYVPEYIIYIFLYTVLGIANFALLMPLMDVLFDTGKQQVVTTLPDFNLSAEYLKQVFYFYMKPYLDNGNQFGVLLYVCAIIFISILLKNIFGFLAQKVLTRMRVNLVRKLRERLFIQYSTQSLRFFHNERKGDLLSTISGDVGEVENSVVTSIQTIFRDPLVIISTFITLFIISKELTLFTLVFFPVSGFLISNLSRKLKKKASMSQNLLGNILNVAEESLSGIRIIKAFNAENFMRKKFDKENNEFSYTVKSIQNQRELASPISEVLGVLVIVVIIVYGGRLILNGQSTLSASAFIAYIALYFQIITPAKNIAGAFTVMQRGLAAGERVLRIIDIDNPIKDKPDAKSIQGFEREIKYNNVTFGYEQTNVLKDVNLTIHKGRMIALVGKSGAGKSTMVDLLPRFYDVTAGAITIDGHDIRDLKTHDLRQQMGMVSQEAILFNDSVLNNIAFGQPNPDPEAVIRAAKIANAHEFIAQLENGYDTVIGERGSKLSGGQRQRLTIARAIFKNPPILILDEATSALDTESEKLVQEALDKLMENRTTIVIAHRLSTIQHAHEIIVLDKGEIKERGNHEALIAQNGIYKRLVEMQEFK
ncbi:ABC transporter ATP-binding protein/permease [Chitinophaga pendula]|uniref:ABC transporter ATP-binding protein n=1 Tax=Chitinophaga TaxID=79328 RepID=UPI000BAF187B|nr:MULTISPECIES: ABC transporter ATP-binding protein [Chitinophaga]ASZ10004.1 antibiotic ABC transporter ATP-binding protein [Chitinophaga sp. MD30]UCJ07052.1 ABC transporter ATP-binding protein/permease [Chitinophaga pendula]